MNNTHIPFKFARLFIILNLCLQISCKHDVATYPPDAFPQSIPGVDCYSIVLKQTNHPLQHVYMRNSPRGSPYLSLTSPEPATCRSQAKRHLYKYRPMLPDSHYQASQSILHQRILSLWIHTSNPCTSFLKHTSQSTIVVKFVVVCREFFFHLKLEMAAAATMATMNVVAGVATTSAISTPVSQASSCNLAFSSIRGQRLVSSSNGAGVVMSRSRNVQVRAEDNVIDLSLSSCIPLWTPICMQWVEYSYSKAILISHECSVTE